MVPSAHGTPTVKLWSFDVRSGGPNQATLLEKVYASLDRALVYGVRSVKCMVRHVALKLTEGLVESSLPPIP